MLSICSHPCSFTVHSPKCFSPLLSRHPMDKQWANTFTVHELMARARRVARRESLLMRSSNSVVQKTPSPNSAAYRKTFMTRRHSSGTSDTPIVRDNSPPTQTPRSSVNNALNAKPLSAFGSYPLVADERRWSIANAECRRPSVLFSVSRHAPFLFYPLLASAFIALTGK